MSVEQIWIIILSLATPIAGVVGFALQLRNVKKTRLENEKLSLEIHCLKKDKEKFFEYVNKLRYGIWYCGGSKQMENHSFLDKLVKTVIGDETMTHEQSLQDDVARIIKRIKEAKENEALAAKADELIEKIRKEL